MKEYFRSVARLMRKPGFIIPLCLTVLVGYGYAMAHVAIGVDDLARSWYASDIHYIRQGRLMGWVLYQILGTDINTIYAEEAIAVLTMLLGAAAWSAVMLRASEDRLKPLCVTAFGCLLVSYPLIAEIWSYSATNLSVGLGYCFTAAALALWMEFTGGRGGWKSLAGAALLVAASYSMFESLILPFAAGACGILILRALYGSPREARPGGLVKNGLWALAPLGAGIALDEGLTRLIVKLMGREMLSWSTHGIAWTEPGAEFGGIVTSLARELAVKFGLFAVCYLPIGIFLAAGAGSLILAAWIAIGKKKPAVLLAYGALIGTLIALPLLQGRFTGYRTCQQFAVFTSFVFMLLLQLLWESVKPGWIRTAAAAAAFCLVTAQACDLSRWTRLDDRRYQEEKRVACDIAGDLQKYDLTKPVVFTGGYALSSSIADEYTVTFENRSLAFLFPEKAYWPVTCKFVETSVQNYLSWSIDAYYTTPAVELTRFFRYLGYDNILPDDGTNAAQAGELALDTPSYPAEGYIVETERFILVVM